MDCSLSEGAAAYLNSLYETYDRFDVQQTTVGVSPDEFSTIDERSEGIAVRVEVTNEKGVLMIPDGNNWRLPGAVIETEPDRSRLVNLVARQAGISCTVDSLDRVSLVCLQCDALDSEVWTLSALFSATWTGGTRSNDAEWHDEIERMTPLPKP
mgnify:CR=1 FL=1|jgi:hypothetical protein